MRFFRSIDILFFVYVIISTLFLALSWDGSPTFYALLGMRVFLLPLVLGLIYLDYKKSHSFLHLLRWTYPLFLSGYFYSETVYYNKLFFKNMDPLWAQVESTIFGMQPSVEFSAWLSNPLFSELMYLGYFSFYLLIVAFALYVFFVNRKYFKEAIFTLSTSLYLFYLIFCIFPSAGPQFYFSAPENALPDAYLFSHIMHFIQDVAEQPTGAFPSSHVGISLIILILAKRNAPKFFALSWPIVLVLFVSTVYIKAHYLIDVLGGLLIAPPILYLSHTLYRLPLWNKLNLSHQAK